MEVKGVVHCKKEPYDVYIGRPSKWGNPFHINDSQISREVSIELYLGWILGQQHLLDALHELDGKILGCWCKPKRCHGDVLAELVKKLGVKTHTLS